MGGGGASMRWGREPVLARTSTTAATRPPLREQDQKKTLRIRATVPFYCARELFPLFRFLAFCVWLGKERGSKEETGGQKGYYLF